MFILYIGEPVNFIMEDSQNKQRAPSALINKTNTNSSSEQSLLSSLSATNSHCTPAGSIDDSYVPSASLEKHRTLAELGALPVGGANGIVYCKKLAMRVRHSDMPGDASKAITVKVSVTTSKSCISDSSRAFRSMTQSKAQGRLDDFRLNAQECADVSLTI